METKRFLNNSAVGTETCLGSEKTVLSELGYKEITTPVPHSYRVGRDSQLQLSKIERDLFTEMEERESGNYIISGISKQVTELDFTAFSFAVGQILYNQSYQNGNEETNSGITQTVSENYSRKLGLKSYTGHIVTSLNELCRLGYGVDDPDARQRKTMETLINVIDSTPVEVQYPNGSYIKGWLCRKMQERYTAENGSIYYAFSLNPIFCSNVTTNFGELPQDIIKRLSGATKKKTTAHYLLLRLLAIQAKTKPFIRTIEELLKDIGLTEAYKVQRSRTEKQLISLFDTMVTIGMIERYEIKYTTIRSKKVISKVTFFLNPRTKLLNE